LFSFLWSIHTRAGEERWGWERRGGVTGVGVRRGALGPRENKRAEAGMEVEVEFPFITEALHYITQHIYEMK
jgi:hypothetical protein